MILVHDFSRFGRDSDSAKSTRRDLLKIGVRVVSVTEPEVDPETVAGVYMEAITYAKNEAYSREVAFHTERVAGRMFRLEIRKLDGVTRTVVSRYSGTVLSAFFAEK